MRNEYPGKFSSGYTFSTACSSSGHAILQAFQFIKSGMMEKAIVLGVDTHSCTTQIGFDSLKLVSQKGTKPLTVERDGLSLGEGGGILFLEGNPGRGRKICGEICGAASSSDGYHISSPDPAGTEQIKCIMSSINEAGITPEDIDYINAHGTGTLMNDEVEMNAVSSVFGAYNPAVTSTKSFIGHTLGASAIDEIAIVLEMLKSNKIIQPKGFPAPMNAKLIPASTVGRQVKYFLKNSFGFGGNNVTLVVKNNIN